MKKQSFIVVLISVFMSIVGTKAFAYDIEVKNNEGVTIFYNYINDGKDLEVTYHDIINNYSDDVTIPEEVT